jgi:hypothetical protein
MLSLATTMTSISLSTKAPFPYVTMPNFDERSKQAALIASSDMLLFAPIVPLHEKALWEQYTWGNIDPAEFEQNEVSMETL